MSVDVLELLRRASDHTSRGDRAGLERVVEDADRAVEAGQDSTLLHFARGRALAWLERPEEAERAFDRALDLDPGNAHARFHRGLIRAARGEHSAAYADFTLASRQDASFADAAFNAGQAASRLGRHDDAVLHFADACRARPGDFEAWRKLVMALRATGRDDEAERATVRLRELAPEGRQQAVVEELRVRERRVTAILRLRPPDAEPAVELAFAVQGQDLVVRLEAVPTSEGPPYALTLVHQGHRSVIGPAFPSRPPHAQVRGHALAVLERLLGGG